MKYFAHRAAAKLASRNHISSGSKDLDGQEGSQQADIHNGVTSSHGSKWIVCVYSLVFWPSARQREGGRWNKWRGREGGEVEGEGGKEGGKRVEGEGGERAFLVVGHFLAGRHEVGLNLVQYTSLLG